MIAPSEFKKTFIAKFNSIQDISLRKRSGIDEKEMYAMQLDELARLIEFLDFTVENIPVASQYNIVSYEFLHKFHGMFERWLVPIKKSVSKRAHKNLLSSAIDKLENTISLLKALIDHKDLLYAAEQLVRIKYSEEENIFRVRFYTYDGPRDEGIFAR
jgi:hypothetical protein